MTKERLRQYRNLKLEERQLKEQENTIETKASEALQAFYREKRERLTSELLAIEKAIEGLDVRARTLIRDYYINGLTWEEVSERNHYCLQHCHRIHSDALIALKKV